jgi:hypothetical protein
MKKHFKRNPRFNGLELLEEKRIPLHRRMLNAVSRLSKGA